MKKVYIAPFYWLVFATYILAQAEGKNVNIMPLKIKGLYAPIEFLIKGIPCGENPFDPEKISVDVEFTSPDGTKIIQPGFWYQDYQSILEGGQEILLPTGEPHWRVRYTPRLPGQYEVKLLIKIASENEEIYGPWFFELPDTKGSSCVFVQPGQSDMFLKTETAQVLPLIGHCVCWHHSGGIYDYKVWFERMAQVGENFTRIWMAPWAFGIETEPNSLTNYKLDRAWQLDKVFEMALDRGIYILLCLDYHGMYEEQPDYWGGNNFWPKNPYNKINGGPCTKQNDFFTDSTAEHIYRKRLRYLIARYGAYPNLLAWQFFNEIDNVYKYLQPSDVASWHTRNGQWLRKHDPWRHLITTSLTGGSVRQEIWQIPELDLVVYHSYGEAHTTLRFSKLMYQLRETFGKPVLIGEFGTDWRGWRKEQDPYLRGWRQGLWAGALSGSVGSAMSWWWESIHSENLYTVFEVMHKTLLATGWHRPGWQQILFPEPQPPPKLLGERVDGESFDVTLILDPQWGSMPSGVMAIGSEQAAWFAPQVFNAFIHGSGHPNLRRPFIIWVWLDEKASLVAHVNSVSDGAIFTVFVDGKQIFQKQLPNLDGKSLVNNEYNIDVEVPLPAGKHRIEIRNTGGDWFYLDWVKLNRVLPAKYEPDWNVLPFACGLKQDDRFLVYMVNPALSFPNNAMVEKVSPYKDASLIFTNIANGNWIIQGFDPKSGACTIELTALATNHELRVVIPELTEDLLLVGRLRHQHIKNVAYLLEEKMITFEVVGEEETAIVIEKSEDLQHWESYLTEVINHMLNVKIPVARPYQFFRARFSSGSSL